jgi:diacylglycerol kinase (ATP)
MPHFSLGGVAATLVLMVMTRRARMVINPTSRTLPSRDRLAVASAWLELHGWTVDECRTSAPLEAVDCARDAAGRGYDVVIAAGGDGTVNEVVNGIAGSQTALAVIPGGTANVWVRELGAPWHPGDVAAMVNRGERRRMDLGIAGDRYFLLMASLGIDSTVTAVLPSDAKQRFGRLAYVTRGLRELTRYRAVDARISVDGKPLRLPLLLALLGNTRSYGGVLAISHQASAVDGKLDLVAYRAGGLIGFAGQLLSTALGWHHLTPGTVYRRAERVTIETRPAVPVQADGEVIGQTPMTFSIAPRAVDVIVPAGSHQRMFDPPAASRILAP